MLQGYFLVKIDVVPAIESKRLVGKLYELMQYFVPVLRIKETLPDTIAEKQFKTH
jgi:hypothetical protein